MDDLILEILLVLSIAPPVALYLASRRSIYDRMQGSALHPFNVLGFLLAFISVDFFELYIRVSGGDAGSFARFTISTVSEILEGMFFFLLSGFALAGGVYLGSRSSGPVNTIKSEGHSSKIVLYAAMAFTAITTFQIVIQSLSYGSIFYIAGIRQTFFSDNVMLQVFFATLVPAYILFSANNYQKSAQIIFIFSACAILILPIGSRGALLYLFLVAGVILVSKGLRVPVFIAYVLSPLLLVFSTYLRFLREHSGADTFQRYLEIRGSGAFLGGEDFNLSEAIIVGMRPDILPRYPFETFVGMVTAIIPRSVIPWKPEGPSSLFSSLADPARWRLTGSEWLITGFVNLRVELGYVGALVAMSVIAYFWARAVTRSFRAGRTSAIAVSTFAIIFAYLFVRGDLYNASLFAWPVLIVWMAGKVVARFKPVGRDDRSAALKGVS